MKCNSAALDQLAYGDEPPELDQAVLEHLDQCEHCQSAMDQMFSRDRAASQFSTTLRGSLESDLTLSGLSEIDTKSHTEADDASFDTSFLGEPSHPELLGRLGRYDIQHVLGRGGMGVVFKAYDTDLHRVVAIKVLAPHLANNGSARKRFSREAQAAAAVLHPNVLRIHNVEANEKTPYLVMQFVSGNSLQTRVQRHGPLDVTDVLRIAKQTSEALAAAHGQGLIHRDVKPANILLEDETDCAVLGDFGLARAADDASMTQTGIVAGTPHYMSPEQASGESATAQSDLFALGGVIYFMLTGRPPFRAESAMSVLHCVCTKRHTPVHELNNSVPREVSTIVDRLLNKRPGNRFTDAKSLSAQLENLLSQVQSGKLRLGADDHRQKLFLGTAVSVACAAGLFFAVGYALNGNKTDGESQPRDDKTASAATSTIGHASSEDSARPEARDPSMNRSTPPDGFRATERGDSESNQFRQYESAFWQDWNDEFSRLSQDLLAEEKVAHGNSIDSLGGQRDPWTIETLEVDQELSQLEQVESQLQEFQVLQPTQE